MIGSYTAPKEHGILVVFSGPSRRRQGHHSQALL